MNCSSASPSRGTRLSTSQCLLEMMHAFSVHSLEYNSSISACTIAKYRLRHIVCMLQTHIVEVFALTGTCCQHDCPSHSKAV